MPVSNIQRVAFVGAGTMGCYNACIAALAGKDVVIFDIAGEDAISNRLSQVAAGLLASAVSDEVSIATALAGIVCASDLASAVEDVDLVSESVFEQLETKRQILTQLTDLASPGVFVTTNTSQLLLSDIDMALERGEDFAALHSYLGSPLVDVLPGPRARAGMADALADYVSSLGCTPLILHRENPGYLLNAMLGQLFAAALALHIDEQLPVAAIDATWCAHSGAMMGPFAVMDMIGLDLIADGWRARSPGVFGYAHNTTVLALLEAMLQRGELGQKSARGFYDYSESQETAAGLDTQQSEHVRDVLTLALGFAASRLVQGDIASCDTVETAWKVGAHMSTGALELFSAMPEARRRAVMGECMARQYIDKGVGEGVQNWWFGQPGCAPWQ